MKYTYYAVLEEEKEYFNVSFPDLPGVLTYGKGIKEAVENAQDALNGALLLMEEDQESMPEASTYNQLAEQLNEKERLQLIIANTDVARALEENKTVNKMVTLPKYLVKLGKEHNVNFSQVLQQALRDKLKI
ncbi:type II toxin-antitoxin system HicB family antitoxin [Staphylococcus pettenkoferi]|uniref:type II toxin-antitoxin system HicB family antitoxin n=1 Tax=Staphylococcus pettenkoferi TaxID=170573 RepID=UPI0022751D11|nr:type II toxin-antitoxin system HicB family antitoxin [Staphylococcus pettenkoferi]MCY1590387.1 type II toxin-antitoxin system HicB family antitoxin [Staphylococcus pettenkoferi]MCY1598715.1 type II toxin-antitoxin system HicB family antitoxin [Staphylococcus pettenkoferi]MCY1614060.1 type II toxin-antitoxin system HicB family antitoxin [Staphylococcus pettenkoferi]